MANNFDTTNTDKLLNSHKIRLTMSKTSSVVCQLWEMKLIWQFQVAVLNLYFTNLSDDKLS